MKNYPICPICRDAIYISNYRLPRKKVLSHFMENHVKPGSSPAVEIDECICGYRQEITRSQIDDKQFWEKYHRKFVSHKCDALDVWLAEQALVTSLQGVV